jgi:endonuclease/exonuclease/phosphatase family metal-dependent hydrolase
MIRIIVVIIVIALILLARKSTTATGKSGVGLITHKASVSKESTQSDVLKVATYNIQTGKNLNGKRDLIASAKVIADADLVGVQEVYATGFDGVMSLVSGQAERLAKIGKFDWLFSATGRRWFREHRGNAILSKVTVSDWRVEMLPDQSGKSFRNMTIAQVYWQGSSFHFINTHLHTRGGREDQLKVVLQEFAKYPRAILLGDFNSRASSDGLANALKDIEIVDAVSAAGLDLDNHDRIDWILTKGFKVVDGKMQEKGVSDHPYYQVSLSYD